MIRVIFDVGDLPAAAEGIEEKKNEEMSRQVALEA